MTTVINFNFLNFYRLSQNNISATNEVHSNNRHTDALRKDYPLQNDDVDIIDVTPHGQALIDNNNDEGIPNNKAGEGSYLANPSGIESIYNRNGKPIQCIDAKGLLVDSYV